MKYLLTYLLFLSGYALHSQCGLTKSYVLKDLDNDQADTTNIAILVEGAVNNNLATPQQGVCGVTLKFRHPFMKELFVELIAPSGQKITLVGGDIIATNTGFITWDVTFVPCGASASPDPGFLDQWENNQLWQNFSNYTGQYYPYLGCLEGFNIGPVNGTWTIRCIDFEDGGNGTLLDANIIFCQDQGVSCGECTLNPGIINNVDMTTCQGDESLNLTIDKTFPNNIFNSNVYDYTNVIFRDSTIIAYSSNPDLRTFPAGKYIICGTQVSKLQSNVMPAIGARFDPNTLMAYFFGLGACASVSGDCMVIDISASIAPITRNVFLCSGQSYIINGESYDTQGNYQVIIENGACDSLIDLNINVLDIRANIDADRDSISCNGNTIGLQGSNQGSPVANISYHWFTNNGELSGDPSFFTIDAIKEGQYFLEITAQTAQLTCKDTIMKEIFPDRTFPIVSFETEVIICLKDTVFIKANISRPTQSTQWSSKDMLGFITTTEGIRVWNPGVYHISVIADNGCSVTDSVEVFRDTFFRTPVFTVEVLDCKIDSVAIHVAVDSTRNLSYLWENVLPDYTTSKSPYVFDGGIYYVTITDIENGCTGSYMIDVLEDRVKPAIIEFNIDTITCLTPSVEANLVSNVPLASYVWSGQNFISNLPSPSFDKKGTYSVTIVSSLNGCSEMLSFEIVLDTILPEITLMADSLTCNRDSVQIILSSDKVLTSIFWYGPGGFVSNEASPFVKLDGYYTVRASSKNGCEVQEQILISYGLDIPDAILPGDSLKCGLDTIRIRLLPKRMNYSYLWSGPGLLENNVISPLVNVPGIYVVTITDNVTGCTAKKIVNIVDHRIYTIADINVSVLDCAKDSVQIILNNTDVVSIVYQGPGFYSEMFSPFVTQVGTYTYTLVNNRNCITTGSIDVVSNDEIPLLNVITSPLKCNQDSFLIEGRSSISGTVFTWLGPNGFEKVGDIVYAYLGGDYILRGLAPNGCVSEVSFSTAYDTIPPDFDILPFGALTCKDTLVTLATNLPLNEAKIIWMNNVEQPTLDVTSPGAYIVSVIGNNQCITTKTVFVTENKNFPTYTATATVINCKDMVSDVIVTPTSPFKSISWQNPTNPSSIADGILITKTSFAGTYTFNLENEEGCITNGSIDILTDLDKPEILEVITGEINCENTTINIGVNISGNIIEYLWNGPGLNDFIGGKLISISQEGQYFLKITGANYCVSSQVFDISKNEDIPRYSLFSDTLTCDKGKINIGVIPGSIDLTYLWSGPMLFESTIRNPRVFDPGLYIVTITGNNGCFLIDSIRVFQDIVKPSITIADTLYLPCDTSAITLMVGSDSEILRYNWLFPDGSLVNSASPQTNQKGNYRIQIAGLNGCGSINKSFYVEVDKTRPVFSVTTDTINCIQSEALLNVQSTTPDVKYLWQSPTGILFTSPFVLTRESGVFSLIVSDKNKCTDSILVTVALDTIRPKIDIIKSGDIQCEVRSVSLDASLSDMGNNIQALWRTLDGNITFRQSDYLITLDKAGIYTFELNNTFNGCMSSKDIPISETPQQFTILETDATAPICDEISNGSIRIVTLNGLPPHKITFNGVPKNGQLIFGNLSSGTYLIEVTDGSGCKQIRNVEVPKSVDLTLDIEKIVEINFGDSILLQPIFNIDTSGMAVLKWYKRDSLICDNCDELWVRPFVNTYYTIEYSNGGFCKETVDVLIKVSNELEKAIPNIFRPFSGNGNDYFYIPQTRGIELINSIYIFDRWAENVYKAVQIPSGEPSLGWDGNFNGKECQPGVYVVIAEFTLSNGVIWKYKGDVLLVR